MDSMGSLKRSRQPSLEDTPTPAPAAKRNKLQGSPLDGISNSPVNAFVTQKLGLGSDDSLESPKGRFLQKLYTENLAPWAMLRSLAFGLGDAPAAMVIDDKSESESSASEMETDKPDNKRDKKEKEKEKPPTPIGLLVQIVSHILEQRYSELQCVAYESEPACPCAVVIPRESSPDDLSNIAFLLHIDQNNAVSGTPDFLETRAKAILATRASGAVYGAVFTPFGMHVWCVERLPNGQWRTASSNAQIPVLDEDAAASDALVGLSRIALLHKELVSHVPLVCAPA